MSEIGIVLIVTGALGIGPSVAVLLIPPHHGYLRAQIWLQRAVFLFHIAVLAGAGVWSVATAAALRDGEIDSRIVNESQGDAEAAVTGSPAPTGVAGEGESLVPSSGQATTVAQASGTAAPQYEAPATSTTSRTATGLLVPAASVAVDAGTPVARLRAVIRTVGRFSSHAAVAGALIGLILLGGSIVRLRRHERSIRSRASCSRLRNATVYRSPLVVVPFTSGVLRPRVYLPVTDDGEMPNQSWKSSCSNDVVLAHEMTHVEHHDIAWNTAELLLRAILWFTPFSHILASRGRVLREMRADEVSAATTRPADYIRTLMAFAEQSSMPVAASALSAPMTPARARSGRFRLFAPFARAFGDHGSLIKRSRRLLVAPRRVSIMRMSVALAAAIVIVLPVAACVTPGVRDEYLGIPLGSYSIVTIDTEGRALRTETFDGETRELIVTSDYEYRTDAEGRVIQMRTYTDERTGLASVSVTPWQSNTELELPYIRWYYPENRAPASDEYVWPRTWELVDSEGLVRYRYIVDYDYYGHNRSNDIWLTYRTSNAFERDSDGSYTVREWSNRIYSPRQSAVHEFTADGTKISTTRYDASGGITSRLLYDYDDQGRPVRMRTVDGDGVTTRAVLTSHVGTDSRVEASYFHAASSRSSGWNGSYFGYGGPWSVVVGDRDQGVAVSVLTKDIDKASRSVQQHVSALLLEEILTREDELAQAYERMTTDFSSDPALNRWRSESDGTSRLATVLLRVSSNGVIAVEPPSREAAQQEVVEEYLVANLLSAIRAHGESNLIETIEEAGAEECTFLVELTLNLGLDESSGLHYVSFPDALYAIVDRVPHGVGWGEQIASANVTDLLPERGRAVLGEDMGDLIVSLAILPDGSIVDPYVVFAASARFVPNLGDLEALSLALREARIRVDPTLEIQVIDRLFGHQFPATGLDTEVSATMRVSLTGSGSSQAFISSRDPALEEWLTLLSRVDR
jgi:beta-lactamase regulating signal transducer with metallopeptidase domain